MPNNSPKTPRACLASRFHLHAQHPPIICDMQSPAGVFWLPKFAPYSAKEIPNSIEGFRSFFLQSAAFSTEKKPEAHY
jgi:hypothetical protein